jgi:signal transduction histidine kinase
MTDVQALQKTGNEAAQTGLIGLCFSVLVGVSGSILLAYHINRSAKELKRGIQQIGQNGKFQPVRVLSRDELGELSEVFNDMSVRLRQEDERRSDFISMLSHEIRTPMTSIKESLSMIQDGTTGPVSEKQQRLLSVSSQEVDRLIELLNRLMSASALSANGLKLNLERIDMAPVVQAAIERIQPMADQKGITVAVSPNGLNTAVMADREHIQQVLINVLGNAVKFCNDHASVHIGSLPWKDKKFAVFRIQDEGPGIPDNEAAYIFDKYYRGSSVRRGIDGTGLGLHISKQIIQAHGGEMWLEQADGKGSVFCFTLPKSS